MMVEGRRRKMRVANNPLKAENVRYCSMVRQSPHAESACHFTVPSCPRGEKVWPLDPLVIAPLHALQSRNAALEIPLGSAEPLR